MPLEEYSGEEVNEMGKNEATAAAAPNPTPSSRLTPHQGGQLSDRYAENQWGKEGLNEAEGEKYTGKVGFWLTAPFLSPPA